ncbi:MAG: hypothetical protein AAFQ80_01125 [Cyanobacteria bacterium J06621_8]
MNRVKLSSLKSPETGRAYLKAALEQKDETVFLAALHNIIDSFADSEIELPYQENKVSTMKNTVTS